MNLKYSALLLCTCLFIISACGSDEDCSASNYEGTWVGVLECNDGEDPEDVALIASVNDAGNILTLTDAAGETSEVEIMGCDIVEESITDPLFGAEITTSGKLDGDKLEIYVDSELFGIKIECTTVLRRE